MNGESNSYLTESKKSWPPCRHGGSRHSWMSSLLSCYCKLSVAMIDSILLRAPLPLPLNMSVAQKVTEAELSRHTFFTGTKNASEARKQCKKKMKKHGFILFSNRHNVPKNSCGWRSGGMGLHSSQQAPCNAETNRVCKPVFSYLCQNGG